MRPLLFFLFLPLVNLAQTSNPADSVFTEILRNGKEEELIQLVMPQQQAENLAWEFYQQMQKEFAKRKGEKILSRKEFNSEFRKNYSVEREQKNLLELFRELRSDSSQFDLKNLSWTLTEKISLKDIVEFQKKGSSKDMPSLYDHLFLETYSLSGKKGCARIMLAVMILKENKYLFESKVKIMPVLCEDRLYEMFIEVLTFSRDKNPFLVVNVKEHDKKEVHELCIDTRTFIYLRSNYRNLPDDPEQLKNMFPDRTLSVDSVSMNYLQREFFVKPGYLIDELNFLWRDTKGTEDIADKMNRGILRFPTKDKADIRIWAHRLFLSGIMSESGDFQNKDSIRQFTPLFHLPE